MTGPTTRATPKIALDQRASSRHDNAVTTVGLDLAKQRFQVHGVDALGRVVVAKPIRRDKLLEFFASLPPCLVGLEASGSGQHWARELIKLAVTRE